MSRKKKQIRQQFRTQVFARDGYRCVACGKPSSAAKAQAELDAHHITTRRDMPNGGYVPENGVSLCKHPAAVLPTVASCQLVAASLSCHEKAEAWLQEGQGIPGYSPQTLYDKIGSSYQKAYQASLAL